MENEVPELKAWNVQVGSVSPSRTRLHHEFQPVPCGQSREAWPALAHHHPPTPSLRMTFKTHDLFVLPEPVLGPKGTFCQHS